MELQLSVEQVCDKTGPSIREVSEQASRTCSPQNSQLVPDAHLLTAESPMLHDSITDQRPGSEKRQFAGAEKRESVAQELNGQEKSGNLGKERLLKRNDS